MRRGRRPRLYWSYEVGHILPAVTPDNIGRIRATDLMGAVKLFDVKWRAGDE